MSDFQKGYNGIYGHDLGRQGKETQQREWSDKRHLSPQQECGW